ncbi:MAG: tRNA (guanine(10)-N(2))-dimethyltransferase [Candidatus Hydrothermarchaeaceae archaeon]
MLKEITEGHTRLLVPEELLEGRIERRPVFYNPLSKLSRDVSCAAARALAKKEKLHYLDLLAGTGARGIRIANEAGCSVHLNDANPETREVMMANAELNGVEVAMSNVEGNLLMRENPGAFDFIDIDPYGSPAPYLGNATATVKRKGLIAFAATDTAALHGLYPKTCLRRYSALPLRCEFGREVGLRILLGYAARNVASRSRGMRCILSHSTRHYFRAYLHMSPGRRAADSALEDMGYLYYCRNCLDRRSERQTIPRERRCECGGEYEVAGPLWLGGLLDEEFRNTALEKSRYLADAEVEKLLSTLASELDEPFYYDVHALCRKMKISAPKMEEVMEELRDSGFDVSRTHFSPTAIKTNASVEDVKRALLPVFLLLAVLA